jgi:5-methyltetrahydropteroyltriglutamate--homocysteine methyltransferase
VKRSTQRILTTHAGSLPRPAPLIEINRDKLDGKEDAREYGKRLAESVAAICQKQAELGIDVPNDGEFGKATRGPVDYGAWQSYLWPRLSGWELASKPLTHPPGISTRRDRAIFAEFYKELDNAPGGFVSSSAQMPRPPVVVAPLKYVGHAAVQADIKNLKTAMAATKAEEGFITSIAPGSFGRRQNTYYKTDDEYLTALADALHEEYKAIVDAGFVLQLDDPGLPDNWDMTNPAPTLAEYRKFAASRIEALNHALRGLPEDRVRYHICWGSWHGPHTTDVPLKDIVDIMLTVRAQAFSVEAGNVRHEHEWKVWRDTKLPDGKILIPGVVSHATNVVEHPELVADRILNYARVVGRENVIAGTDCGLGGRIHESLAWAKLQALSDGAALASRELWR